MNVFNLFFMNSCTKQLKCFNPVLGTFLIFVRNVQRVALAKTALRILMSLEGTYLEGWPPKKGYK